MPDYFESLTEFTVDVLSEWPTEALRSLHKRIGGILADRALGNTRDDALRRMHESIARDETSLPFD